jgi:hypothetical protein
MVTELLHARGCFLGGLIPRWLDDVGMLIQKLLDVPDWDGVLLHSDEARDSGGYSRGVRGMTTPDRLTEAGRPGCSPVCSVPRALQTGPP